jgi:hypothetical protein
MITLASRRIEMMPVSHGGQGKLTIGYRLVVMWLCAVDPAPPRGGWRAYSPRCRDCAAATLNRS